ncbi:hypothetical protein [Pseudarthrobacter sp. ATCC 49987]|uniref:hypothetical protein n=1 Tax=Pseudarthrobacter sp. ATCC 49987 TaxID=2698204 RepID=UPI00136C6F70|nr:hypothetical protein [Pseudarthrobacter sp. ATCC 49987]
MTRSKIAPRTGRAIRSRRFRKLPVPVSTLRWALIRRLSFAVPVGLFLGWRLNRAFNTEESGSGTAAAIFVGLGLSFALFLGIIWLLGRSRRAAFLASGGVPNATGVLLFGVMVARTPKTRPGRRHGDGGSGWRGDGGGGGGSDGSDCGSGDGGGGGGCD